ncbi:MAG: hypothetical protein KDA55_14935, partial [Planctomycetales bacterium]|nr:hypothetical protein [Planctomycetales bacterium]
KTDRQRVSDTRRRMVQVPDASREVLDRIDQAGNPTCQVAKRSSELSSFACIFGFDCEAFRDWAGDA